MPISTDDQAVQCGVEIVPLICRSPLSTFVGLKNGGATCYMNAVFQQLFMQPSIRKMLLSVPESSDGPTESVFFQMQASSLARVVPGLQDITWTDQTLAV